MTSKEPSSPSRSDGEVAARSADGGANGAAVPAPPPLRGAPPSQRLRPSDDGMPLPVDSGHLTQIGTNDRSGNSIKMRRFQFLLFVARSEEQKSELQSLMRI